MQQAIQRPTYAVARVEKVTSPEGLPGDNWHRYVIECGDSTIEGLKSGTLNAVTEHAQCVAADLNERQHSGGSTYAPRSRRQPKR